MKGFALLRETDKSFDYHQLRLSSATGRREHGSRRHRPCRIERADPLYRFVICSNSAALYLKDKACFHVSGDVRRRSDLALRILAEAPATCGVFGHYRELAGWIVPDDLHLMGKLVEDFHGRYLILS
jgi:hypothetical protein